MSLSSAFWMVYCASEILEARVREVPEYVMDKREFAVFNWSISFYPNGWRLKSNKVCGSVLGWSCLSEKVWPSQTKCISFLSCAPRY